LYLVEDGTPLEQVSFDPEAPIILVLGDDQGLPAEHEALVLQHSAQKVRIGTRSLLGSQVVSLFLLELKKRMETKR
jgi:tRNA pseudouridine-54 N-methylase